MFWLQHLNMKMSVRITFHQTINRKKLVSIINFQHILYQPIWILSLLNQKNCKRHILQCHETKNLLKLRFLTIYIQGIEHEIENRQMVHGGTDLLFLANLNFTEKGKDQPFEATGE